MKVYAIMEEQEGGYAASSIFALFPTRELAEEAKKKLKEKISENYMGDFEKIEEFEVYDSIESLFIAQEENIRYMSQ